MRIRGAGLALACALLGAPPAAAQGKSAVPGVLAGRWRLLFTLDSVPRTSRQAEGTLDVGERAELHLDLPKVVGAPLECYDARTQPVQVRAARDSLEFILSRTTADCDVSAIGALRGDSVTGIWTVFGFEGTLSVGHFRMGRVPPDSSSH
jgi:hypothetical protein